MYSHAFHVIYIHLKQNSIFLRHVSSAKTAAPPPIRITLPDPGPRITNRRHSPCCGRRKPVTEPNYGGAAWHTALIAAAATCGRLCPAHQLIKPEHEHNGGVKHGATDLFGLSKVAFVPKSQRKFTLEAPICALKDRIASPTYTFKMLTFI